MAERRVRRSTRVPARRRVSAFGAPPDELVASQSEVPRGGLGMDRSRQAETVTEVSWASFEAHLQALARSISRSYSVEAVVGVALGGVFVGGALASALDADFYPVRISRRSRLHTDTGRPRLSGSMPKELKGRRVLVVDDVSASGETLELAKALARKAGARSLRTATLVCRTDGYAPDYTALRSDNLLVFPWDYAPVTEDGRFDARPVVRAARSRGRG